MLVRTAGGNYGMWTKVGQEGQKQDGGGLESRVGTPRRRPAAEGEESGELRLPSFGLVLEPFCWNDNKCKVFTDRKKIHRKQHRNTAMSEGSIREKIRLIDQNYHGHLT